MTGQAGDTEAVDWPPELLCPAGDQLEVEEAYHALAYLLGPGSPSRDGWTRLDSGDVARILYRLDGAHDALIAAIAAALPSGTTEPPRIGNDPTCPCQDGDVCHYVDDPESGTKAFPIPGTTEQPAPGAGKPLSGFDATARALGFSAPGEEGRCDCATFGNARLCPVHTQADYDAAELTREPAPGEEGLRAEVERAVGCVKRNVQVGTVTHGGPAQYEDRCSAHWKPWPCEVTERTLAVVRAALAAREDADQGARAPRRPPQPPPPPPGGMQG